MHVEEHAGLNCGRLGPVDDGLYVGHDRGIGHKLGEVASDGSDGGCSKKATLASFTYPVSLIVTLVIGHVMRDEKLTAKETADVLIAAVACALLVS